MIDRLLPNSVTFVDISPWVKERATAGHVFTFHSRMLNESAVTFRKGLIFGPKEEASHEITPIFRDSYFHRGLGTLLQSVNMSRDMAKAIKALDNLDGIKLLHFYEGGFRELTFLYKLLSSRDDCVAVFNFFASEPWARLFSRNNPFSRVSIKIMSDIFASTMGHVAFTADTPKFAELFARVFEGVPVSVYPLFSNIEPESTTSEKWKTRPISFLFTPRTLAEQKLTVRSIKLLQDRLESNTKIVIASRWTAQFTDKSLQRISNSNLDIEILPGPFSDEQYESLFFKTKVVVLPYLDRHYVFGSSGKALDARNGGCWVVAPAGASVGDLIARNVWGKTFDGSATNLAEVLCDAFFADPPSFKNDEPVIAKSIEFFVDKLGSLQAGRLAGARAHSLHALPFLVGIEGLPWLTRHLILLPGKRFFDWVTGIVKRK